MMDLNGLSIVIAGLFGYAVVRGGMRGASGSMRELSALVFTGIVTVVGIFVAWRTAGAVSPHVQQWLASLTLTPPAPEASSFSQSFHLAIAALRDFGLLRFGFILLVVYLTLQRPLEWVARRLLSLLPATVDKPDEEEEDDEEDDDEESDPKPQRPPGRRRRSFLSMLAGSFVGLVLGTWRALVVITFLFVLLTLFPQAPYAGYVQDSQVYQFGVRQIVEPFSGDFIKNRVPVWTQALEQQLQDILRQKYALVDAHIQTDIQGAAQRLTAQAETEEEKARALYVWIGTRITYDWDKVRLYERERIWLEQTPDDTFRTRKGVCIDYARLYAVMARAVGLQAEVVTGLGYDGRGGYGPHAWNEVVLADGRRLPLDATWHSGGGDWFNPPDFYRTHVIQ